MAKKGVHGATSGKGCWSCSTGDDGGNRGNKDTRLRCKEQKDRYKLHKSLKSNSVTMYICRYKLSAVNESGNMER
nr:hypothetical protein CFP56_67898 [Quercus suber]